MAEVMRRSFRAPALKKQQYCTVQSVGAGQSSWSATKPSPAAQSSKVVYRSVRMLIMVLVLRDYKQASSATGTKQLVYKSVRKLVMRSILGDSGTSIPSGSTHPISL
jgi:hypothetical protein